MRSQAPDNKVEEALTPTSPSSEESESEAELKLKNGEMDSDSDEDEEEEKKADISDEKEEKSPQGKLRVYYFPGALLSKSNFGHVSVELEYKTERLYLSYGERNSTTESNSFQQDNDFYVKSQQGRPMMTLEFPITFKDDEKAQLAVKNKQNHIGEKSWNPLAYSLTSHNCAHFALTIMLQYLDLPQKTKEKYLKKALETNLLPSTVAKIATKLKLKQIENYRLNLLHDINILTGASPKTPMKVLKPEMNLEQAIKFLLIVEIMRLNVKVEKKQTTFFKSNLTNRRQNLEEINSLRLELEKGNYDVVLEHVKSVLVNTKYSLTTRNRLKECLPFLEKLNAPKPSVGISRTKSGV